MVEDHTGLYLVRLFAFLLILGAIVDKNRSSRSAPRLTLRPTLRPAGSPTPHAGHPPRLTSATRSLRA